MGEDKTRNEQLAEKAKPKRKKTAKTKETAPESGTEPIKKKVEPQKIEPKKKAAPKKKVEPKKAEPKKKTVSDKKKATTRKKKSVTDDRENQVEILKEDIIAEAVQPTGQGKISQIKVDVIQKNAKIECGRDNLLPELKTFQGATVQTEPAITATTRVEAAQTAALPFAAIKVRNVVGKVVDLTTEIIPNKVIVQGIVHEQVYFVGTDNIVHHLADDVHFSAFLDIPGAQPGMNAQVTAIIEEIIPELAADGLSLTKKIILEVFVKVTETVQLHLLPGNGPLILLKQVVGENTAQTLVENEIALDVAALKIEEIVGKIIDLNVEVIPNKVIIQGTLHKQIFLVGLDNIGRHQGEDIPFSLFVDLPGATPGMDVQVHPRIEVILFELVSPTLLRQKAVMEFFVKVTENIRQQVTLGNGPLFKVEEFIGENLKQELNETVVTLAVPAVKVREIVARIVDLTSYVITDKVIVQGTLHKQIFFIGTDNIERHQAEDLPFSIFLDIPGATPGDNVRLNPVIEAIFFELVTSTQLRQKVILAINAVVTREVQLNLVVCDGPLYKLEQVVGENTKQLLIVRKEVIPPPAPVLPITISEVTVVFPRVVGGEQQIILRNEVELPVTAVKIKEIQANVVVQNVNVISDAVVVEGIIQKTVFFVDTGNIVRTTTEDLPFSILVSVPGIVPGQSVTVNVEIENISFNLSESGNSLVQNIVLLAIVNSQVSPQGQVTVVTDVSGPGVVQSKVRVRAFVSTSTGTVLQEFDVVTDVSGPGIAGVEKQTLPLDVVGDNNPNPVPVAVVTRVILE